MSTKTGRIGCDTPRPTLKMKLPIPSRSFKSMPSNETDFFSLKQLNILKNGFQDFDFMNALQNHDNFCEF